MDLALTLNFLNDLAKNNNKEWMLENKGRYQKAKEQVVELIADVIKGVAVFDPLIANVDPKKSLFRINRDIRFSTNKDPYKTNFGAFLVDGGRNSVNPGYYIHLQPGNSFLGGGMYQPPADILQKVRQEIDYNGNVVKEIINNENFRAVYNEPYSADKLKTAPKGYSKDHENIELLQLKHYAFMRPASDDEVISEAFTKKIIADFNILFPFNRFLRQAID